MKQKDKIQAVFFCLLFILSSLGGGAQPPNIQWQKSFGGSGMDVANSIQQTTDGGYIMVGYSNSNNGDVTSNHGGSDCWVLKTDSDGNMQWQKSYGGSGNDFAYSIQQATDGGYIFGGSSTSNNGDVTGNHGGYDFWVVKIDVSGNIQWQKSFGGLGPEEALSIQQTTDGGYILAGYTGSDGGDVTGFHGFPNGSVYDCWIVKLNSSGSLQWQKCLGGSGSLDAAFSIQQTMEGGYIVGGETNSQDGDVTGLHGGDEDYWVVKLDTNGGIQWQKCLGGTGYDAGLSVQQTIDTGYIMAGYSMSNDGDVTGNHGGTADYWVVKLDRGGVIKWQKSLGGMDEDIPYSVIQTSDGGYTVAGYSKSNDGDVTGHYGASGIEDYWLVKLDSVGVLKWEKSLGGFGVDRAKCIKQTTDGGFIMSGSSDSTSGDVTGNHGGDDFWIVKLDSATVDINELSNTLSISVFPNPTTGKITLSSSVILNLVEIYNIQGEKIYSADNNTQQTSNKIDLRYPQEGVYFVHVKTSEGILIKKIIIQR